MAQPPLSPHFAEEAEPDLIDPPCPPPCSRLAKRQLIYDPPVFRERHHVWTPCLLRWSAARPRRPRVAHRLSGGRESCAAAARKRVVERVDQVEGSSAPRAESRGDRSHPGLPMTGPR